MVIGVAEPWQSRGRLNDGRLAGRHGEGKGLAFLSQRHRPAQSRLRGSSPFRDEAARLW
jgi:hypothetical protein